MNAVFVLGTHRSGIATVCRMVQALGIPGPPPADVSLPRPDDPLAAGDELLFVTSEDVEEELGRLLSGGR
jgi:hypothetical protein